MACHYKRVIAQLGEMAGVLIALRHPPITEATGMMSDRPSVSPAYGEKSALPPGRPVPTPERVQELLFDAARLGRTDVIPALLHAGADLAAIDPKGYTALILASYNGHAEATELLLQRGADIEQADAARGNTALMGVAFKGYVEIVDMLLKAGADAHASNKSGQTALMMAALFGHTAITQRILALGGDPHRQDGAGNSAISVARSQGNEAMIETLNAGNPYPIERDDASNRACGA